MGARVRLGFDETTMIISGCRDRNSHGVEA